MPLLFALGLHRAAAAVQGKLLPSEKVFAFLDDVHVICSPHRVLEVHRILEEELRSHAQISVHHGKTKVWNRSGVPPRGIDVLSFGERTHRRRDASKGRKSSGFPLESQTSC